MATSESDVETAATGSAASKLHWRRRWPLRALHNRVILSWVLLAGVGGLSGVVARNYLYSRPSGSAEQLSLVMQPNEVIETLPQASFSPEEVVRAQVESMRQAVADPAALLICYSLASPSNRQLTGPFERFAGLVSSEPYRQLGVSQDFQIGSALMDGLTATVLVSTLAEDGHGLAFMFTLSKQQDAPYEDCWMTDGVIPLLQQRAQINRTETWPAQPEPRLQTRPNSLGEAPPL